MGNITFDCDSTLDNTFDNTVDNKPSYSKKIDFKKNSDPLNDPDVQIRNYYSIGSYQAQKNMGNARSRNGGNRVGDIVQHSHATDNHVRDNQQEPRDASGDVQIQMNGDASSMGRSELEQNSDGCRCASCSCFPKITISTPQWMRRFTARWRDSGKTSNPDEKALDVQNNRHSDEEKVADTVYEGSGDNFSDDQTLIVPAQEVLPDDQIIDGLHDLSDINDLVQESSKQSELKVKVSTDEKHPSSSAPIPDVIAIGAATSVAVIPAAVSNETDSTKETVQLHTVNLDDTETLAPTHSQESAVHTSNVAETETSEKILFNSTLIQKQNNVQSSAQNISRPIDASTIALEVETVEESTTAAGIAVGSDEVKNQKSESSADAGQTNTEPMIHESAIIAADPAEVHITPIKRLRSKTDPVDSQESPNTFQSPNRSRARLSTSVESPSSPLSTASSNGELDDKYKLIFENLKIIRSIKPNDKLRVSSTGELSIEQSYLPSVTRTLTGNNKIVTVTRIDDTIKVAKQLRKIPQIKQLLDDQLATGLRNLAITYTNDDVFKEKLESLASSF